MGEGGWARALPHIPIPQRVVLMSCVLTRFPACPPRPLTSRPAVHTQTTDTDASEFRPAKAARDGESAPAPGDVAIPDGFYLVSDSARPNPALDASIITAVRAVTHIAPADTDGTILGEVGERSRRIVRQRAS